MQSSGLTDKTSFRSAKLVSNCLYFDFSDFLMDYDSILIIVFIQSFQS